MKRGREEAAERRPPLSRAASWPARRAARGAATAAARLTGYPTPPRPPAATRPRASRRYLRIRRIRSRAAPRSARLSPAPRPSPAPRAAPAREGDRDRDRDRHQQRPSAVPLPATGTSTSTRGYRGPRPRPRAELPVHPLPERVPQPLPGLLVGPQRLAEFLLGVHQEFLVDHRRQDRPGQQIPDVVLTAGQDPLLRHVLAGFLDPLLRRPALAP